MKKVGIVCDNYKIKKFQEQLEAKGYKEYRVTPFKGNTSTIQLHVTEFQTREIKTICEEVELYFKKVKQN